MKEREREGGVLRKNKERSREREKRDGVSDASRFVNGILL